MAQKKNIIKTLGTASPLSITELILPDGTPAQGDTSQEDPPSGSRAGSTASISSQSEGSQTSENSFCDFNILRQRIDKSSSPLFENFPGKVYFYTPYLSSMTDGAHEYKIRVLASDDSNPITNNKTHEVLPEFSYSNGYMSELTFLYKDPKKSVQDSAYQVVPILNPEKHVFLAQTVWFLANEIPSRIQQKVKIKRKRWKDACYIIHDFRPVYLQKGWESPITDTRKIDTIATPITKDDLPEAMNILNFWIVVVRPNKDTLKEKNNKYALGIVSTPKDEVPQIYQDVHVFDYDEAEGDRSHPLKIKDDLVTLQVVPRIDLLDPRPSEPCKKAHQEE